MAIRRIGQIFVDLGFISDDQLQFLLEEQQLHPDQMLGKLAEEMGMISSEQIAQALAEQLDMQVVRLTEVKLPLEILKRVSETMAQMYRVIPIEFDEDSNTLTVAMSEPQNLSVQDELRTFLGYTIKVVVASEQELSQTLEKYYSEDSETLETVVNELMEDSDLQREAEALLKEGAHDLTDMEELADSAPVRKLLNMVLLLAIKDHASDIHFEPFEDEFRIRIKADGVLYEMVPPPRHLAFAIITRIKVMANLDIAERRLPQDGRIELMVGGHPVDLRVSTLPTMFGESAVLRVLDRSVVQLDVEKVGMPADLVTRFREILRKPNGIVLVTGPTGSGKTTTLYSCLNELNDISEKLITTEDPVEYDIDGIIQIPIDTDIGVTFASCLRAILRQDPDKILVGEIRDYETGEIAVQASLTGHLVFSTLHTNDAPSAITRLRDMGVQDFLITATVEAVLAQRLVRRICIQCREEIAADEGTLFQLGMEKKDLQGKTFYRGKGCETCNNTGYKGRIGIFELMVINDDLREVIVSQGTTDQLRDLARQHGMRSLRDEGIDMALAGITTSDEIIRETVMDI